MNHHPISNDPSTLLLSISDYREGSFVNRNHMSLYQYLITQEVPMHQDDSLLLSQHRLLIYWNDLLVKVCTLTKKLLQMDVIGSS